METGSVGICEKFSNFLWDKPHLKACFKWFQRISWHYHCNFVWSKVCQFRLGFQKGQRRYRRISTACPGFRVKSRMSWSKSPSSTIVPKKKSQSLDSFVADTKATWLRIPFWKLFLWGWLSFMEIYWFWSVIEFEWTTLMSQSWTVPESCCPWWVRKFLNQKFKVQLCIVDWVDSYVWVLICSKSCRNMSQILKTHPPS